MDITPSVILCTPFKHLNHIMYLFIIGQQHQQSETQIQGCATKCLLVYLSSSEGMTAVAEQETYSR